ESFVLLVINSVAFAFYLRFVGGVLISFPIMFKVALISAVPSVVLWLKDTYNRLQDENQSLIKEVQDQKLEIDKYEEDYSNQTVEFLSDSGRENLKLLISEVMFIQSANNYVEIFYKEGDKVKSSLIRNTLKNIETQLRAYTNFVRCHRICIVNVFFVEQLHHKYHKYWLTLKEYPEEVPVSRQYLLKLKEAL
ncbi:MAG: LytR/AlgR family response regulator transcription factor, partial [Bacteroidota bacterium]